MKFFALVIFALAGSTAMAQEAAPKPVTPDQARIFVTDSNSWESRGSAGGGGGGNGGGFFGSSAGGARPQTAEVIKTFGQRCPQIIVNNRPMNADYVVELDHEGGKGLLAHKDKIAVFVRTSGDGIFSKSTLSIGGSVQDACKVILEHWGSHATELKAAAVTAAAPPPPTVLTLAGALPVSSVQPGISVDANVANCDIEVDGEFVGNTPSVINLAAGKHQVTVKKTGYTDWSRTMSVSGGSIKLTAEMVAK